MVDNNNNSIDEQEKLLDLPIQLTAGDLSDIMEKIVFHHDCEEDEILKMVKNAKFDLSELDEEGRNIADMAEEQNFMKVVKYLKEKGIKNTWEGTEFEVKSSSTDNK